MIGSIYLSAHLSTWASWPREYGIRLATPGPMKLFTFSFYINTNDNMTPKGLLDKMFIALERSNS